MMKKKKQKAVDYVIQQLAMFLKVRPADVVEFDLRHSGGRQSMTSTLTVKLDMAKSKGLDHWVNLKHVTVVEAGIDNWPTYSAMVHMRITLQIVLLKGVFTNKFYHALYKNHTRL